MIKTMTKKPKITGELTPADLEILTHIAECKISTVTQIAALTQRSKQVVRRRLRYFVKKKLVAATSREFGAGPGARENVVTATEKALALLSSKKKIAFEAAGLEAKAVEPLFIEHELLVNWVFIHLIHIQRSEPRLKVKHHINKAQLSEGR